jgi:hypothetical protein
MSAENLQDAIITQLRNDTDIITEFKNDLIGTLTFQNGSPTVTGASTVFLTELRSSGADGDKIVKGGAIRIAGSSSWYRVKSVESDTELTLYNNFAEANITDTGEHIYIRKGMPRNFNYIEDSRGIFLYLMLENWVQKTVPHIKEEATYPFLITTLFYDNDEESAETRKTLYSKMVRRAMQRDQDLSAALVPYGETIMDITLQDTRFYFNPQVEGGFYLVTPMAVRRREPIGDNP